MTEEQAPYITTLSPLTQTVLNLARARLVQKVAIAMLAAKQDWFRQEYAALFAAANEISERVNNLERFVRVMAEESYDGNKHPAPGVNIRIERVLPDYLPEHALAWCKQHDAALMLDRKTFERFALTGTVTLVDEEGHVERLQPQDIPKAIIAKDLPAHLAAAGIPWEEA